MRQKLEVYEDKKSSFVVYFFEYTKYCSMILVIKINKGRKGGK